MVKTLNAPSKYFQGPNLLQELYAYVSFIGKKFIMLSDDIVIKIVKERLEKGFAETDGTWEYVCHCGESTQAEADRIAAMAEKDAFDGIIGIGGGKVMDTAKLAADICNLPVVIIPTTAATDAPCSSMSVVYDEDGTFIVSKRTKKNPDVVLVDTQVIAEAPVRTFVAGVGDAFASYYEARACKASGAMNYNGGRATEAAYAIAELCNRSLVGNAAEAKKAVEAKQSNEALEKTIEANIYLGGVGFENNGCAIAHGVYNGMTAVIKPFHAMHGEAVAVGVLIQLAAEKIPMEEWNKVISFYRSVGLPTCLEELGVENVTEELLRKLGEAGCTQSPNAHKMPFKVTPEILYEAIKVVQERSRA